MTIRPTMFELTRVLRGMTNAGTADYTVRNDLYWTDEQLQVVLDNYRIDIHMEPLLIINTYIGGGSISYLYYQSEYSNFERQTSGTELFYITDSDGDKLGTAIVYTTDYYRGLVTFASDTGGSAYYLTGRTFDLNSAAADIWRQKAAHYADEFTFSTDNHRIDKGALINNALKMAQVYAVNAPPSVTTLYRSDIDVTSLD